MFLYLHQTDLSNNWQGVVIYPRRSVESVETARYGELINSGRILRFYLEELREGESLHPTPTKNFLPQTLINPELL
ncbi:MULTISPECIES: DUF2887 domain-containing protein [unclassified Microcystis]|uniref:DUF2887 domain-containing protein n=1 Tax=unclassified Microcystis TaxID=2643300 RepID=UPI0022C13E47|nr:MULTISPECIES: DUF2887 domain-containing protein [unclassified Microcystis]MCZ8201412.1 DUF2887 domain-containing protein [Microcystis sp. LE19-55.1A]MCZ8305707.1 DUF2887 domain-containing protein [Microcystis sp. LE19-98.1E]